MKTTYIYVFDIISYQLGNSFKTQWTIRLSSNQIIETWVSFVSQVTLCMASFREWRVWVSIYVSVSDALGIGILINPCFQSGNHSQLVKLVANICIYLDHLMNDAWFLNISHSHLWAAMTPVDMSKIIFNPLINLLFTGAMVPICVTWTWLYYTLIQT